MDSPCRCVRRSQIRPRPRPPPLTGCHIIRADHCPRRTAKTRPLGEGCRSLTEVPRRTSSSCSLLTSAQLLSERGDIDDRPRFTIRPDEKRKKVIPSIPILAPCPAYAGRPCSCQRLPVHRDQILPATVRYTVTLRSGMPLARIGRCAVLLEGVVSRGTVRYEIGAVIGRGRSKRPSAMVSRNTRLAVRTIVRSVGTGTGADETASAIRQHSGRDRTHEGSLWRIASASLSFSTLARHIGQPFRPGAEKV